MRVRVYPGNTYEELGARRFEVEWWTVRPGVKTDDPDEFDWDRDLISNVDWRKTKDAAIRLAQKKANGSFFGCATVQEQVVDWYEEDYSIAEWSNVGNADEYYPASKIP